MRLFCALELDGKLASVSHSSLITIKSGDSAQRGGHNCSRVELMELCRME